ncbi:MAG: RNHCP domain-containing protein [Microgenomates group bacterium]
MKSFRTKSPPNPSLTKEGRRNFLRKIENFICGNCGNEVIGDGYTDHCPKCLWAKHVDRIIPGDRESDCQGMMEPVGTEFRISNFEFQIKYECTKCRHKFRVREGKGDDREKLMELM